MDRSTRLARAVDRLAEAEHGVTGGNEDARIVRLEIARLRRTAARYRLRLRDAERRAS